MFPVHVTSLSHKGVDPTLERGNMHRKHVISSPQLGCAKMEEHHRNAVQILHCHTHRTIGRMRKLGKNQAIYYKTFHCVRTQNI